MVGPRGGVNSPCTNRRNVLVFPAACKPTNAIRLAVLFPELNVMPHPLMTYRGCSWTATKPFVAFVVIQRNLIADLISLRRKIRCRGVSLAYSILFFADRVVKY
jgi:hypothetical protein